MHMVTYFSNLPKVLISMVSPLLQEKATPILREKKYKIKQTPALILTSYNNYL